MCRNQKFKPTRKWLEAETNRLKKLIPEMKLGRFINHKECGSGEYDAYCLPIKPYTVQLSRLRKFGRDLKGYYLDSWRGRRPALEL